MKFRTKNSKLKIIGLTGGIASGKTTILNQFKKFGIRTISCDEIAKKVFYEASVSKKIEKLFGILNRKKIAEIIFSDTKKRRQLEKILHPEIIKDLRKQLSSREVLRTIPNSQFPFVIIDIPLLFEAHLEHLFDKIIVVYCRKNEQINRLMKRSKITKTEAEKRMSSQMPLSKKIKFADFVIDNSTTFWCIKKQIKKVLDKII
ncbi:MAG: dephospho-CoA kinase [Elusimicrobiota bacterium]